MEILKFVGKSFLLGLGLFILWGSFIMGIIWGLYQHFVISFCALMFLFSWIVSAIILDDRR